MAASLTLTLSEHEHDLSLSLITLRKDTKAQRSTRQWRRLDAQQKPDYDLIIVFIPLQLLSDF